MDRNHSYIHLSHSHACGVIVVAGRGFQVLKLEGVPRGGSDGLTDCSCFRERDDVICVRGAKIFLLIAGSCFSVENCGCWRRLK